MAEHIKKRILNVDDNDAGRYATSRILTQAGFEVIDAATGYDALRLARQERPDIVILDVNLPDLNGFEVCRRIKSDPDLAAIPVIHLSATYVRSEDRVEGLNGGADGYLTQPVDPRELVATVRAFLRLTEVERHLRESEARFRGIYQNATIGLYRTSPDGRILMANPALVRLLGYNSFEELAQRNLADQGHAQGFPRQEFLERIEKDGQVIGLESAWITHGGQIVHVLESATAVRDINGDTLYYEGSAENITKRKQAELALRTSEERYRTLVESMGEGMGVLDAQGNLIFANNAFVTMLGYQKEGLLGRPVLELLDQENRQIIIEQLKRRQEGAADPYQLTWTHQHGKKVHTIINPQPLYDELGNFIGSFAVITDITHRVQAEETYSTIIRTSLDGFWMTGATGKFLDVNKAAGDMLGYTRPELLAMSVADIEAMEKPEDVAAHIGKAIKQGYDRFESRHRRKDGSIIDVEVAVNYVEFNNGRFYSFIRDITERKQAEARLEAQNTLLLALIDSPADIIIFSLDQNYCYTAFNQTHRREMRKVWQADIQIGMNLLNLMTIPELRALAKQSFDRVLQGEYITEIQHQTDQDIYYEFNWSPIKQKGGEITGITAFIRDISANKQAEAKIEHLNRVLRAIRKVNQLIVQEKEPRRLIQQAVELLIETRGYGGALVILTDDDGTPAMFAEAGMGEAFKPLAREIQQGIIPPCCHEAQSHPGPFLVTNRAEICAACPLAEICPGTDTMCMQLGRDKKNYGFVAVSLPLGLGQDQEEQALFAEMAGDLAYALYGLRLSQQAGETRDALHQTQDQLQIAVSAGNVGLWDWDLNTNLVYFSPEWKRQIGYEDHEISNKFDEWQSRVHPDDLDRCLKQVHAFIANPWPDYQIEFRFRHKNGSYRWILAQASVLFDPQGQPSQMIGSHLDITRIKELEAEKEQLTAQFYQIQKMESIGRLAGGIAHDFNNMLVPIIGYAELGMNKVQPQSDFYNQFRLIKDAGERAANLTRQILAFSRQQVLEMADLDLNEVVANFEKMLQRLIGETIALQTILLPQLPLVKADRGQLEQVLLNLVVNARDAMPNGGKLTIETTTVILDKAYVARHADVQPGPHIMLAVSDTGHGMDAATQQQIFEPFFTTKERGHGTGLGLATVFGIIKQHNGNIWVYSEPGHGTTFKIYLPIPEAPAPTKPTENAEFAPLHGKETILVVEDEPAVRELVRDMLKEFGYRILIANTPEEALQLGKNYEGGIHLLLTDVIMPAMNGHELYRQLAGLRPDLKVLYMSGYTDNVIAHHGVLKEGVTFLQKPFSARSLLQKVRAALE